MPDTELKLIELTCADDGSFALTVIVHVSCSSFCVMEQHRYYQYGSSFPSQTLKKKLYT
jgi:hypothetical protein